MIYKVSDLQYNPVEKAYHIDSMFHGYRVWKAEDDKGYYIKLWSELEVFDLSFKKDGLYFWVWYRSNLLKVLDLINKLESTHFQTVITKVNFVDMK